MGRPATASQRSRRKAERPTRPRRCEDAVSHWFSFLGVPALGGLVEKELADQLFHDHCGLGLGDPLPILEHRSIAAGIETDINLSQQAGGIDRRNRVLGKLEAAVNAQGHYRFVALCIELYRFDAPDHYAGSLHRRPLLEPPDVVEARFEA